jgi:hypothetical protein
VLDSGLKVLSANPSFYDTFKVTPNETLGNFIYNLGNGQWDTLRIMHFAKIVDTKRVTQKFCPFESCVLLDQKSNG